MQCPACDNGLVDALCSWCRADGSPCHNPDCNGGTVLMHCERCNGTGELDSNSEWQELLEELLKAREIVRDLQRRKQE